MAARNGVYSRGTRLGDYVIDGVVGAGAFSYVYRARRAGSIDPVAIKVLHDSSSKGSLQRFKLESRVGRELLGRRHIVGTLDSGRNPADERCFIVMEYIDCRPLSWWRKQYGEGSFEEWMIRRVGEDIAEGLKAIYEITGTLAHADVKPSNIFPLFLKEGSAAPAKLCDFGVIRHREHRVANQKELVGAPHYTAPEVTENLDYSELSDLFSLGVVLYVMACGRLPFDSPASGTDNVEIAKRYVRSEVPQPVEVSPGVSRALNEVIARSLRRSPSERYGSLNEFKLALGRLSAGPVHGSTSLFPKLSAVGEISLRPPEEFTKEIAFTPRDPIESTTFVKLAIGASAFFLSLFVMGVSALLELESIDLLLPAAAVLSMLLLGAVFISWGIRDLLSA